MLMLQGLNKKLRRPFSFGWRRQLMAVMMLLLMMDSQNALAGSVSVNLDPQNVEVGEESILTITIEGGAEGRPEVGKIDGLDVDYMGQSTNISSSFGFGSGGGFQSRKETIHTYSLRPRREGKFVIPSIELEIDGKKIKSEAKTLVVSSQPAGGSNAGVANSQGGAIGQAESARDFFVEREVAQDSAYVGEAVLVKTKFYTRVSVNDLKNVGETSKKFRSIRREEPLRFVKTIDGVEYSVIELIEVMIPLKSGKLVIPPAAFEVQFISQEAPRQRPTRNRRGLFDQFFEDPFFGSRRQVRRKIVQSKEASLMVNPLPAKDRPKNFSGIVGQVQMTVDLSQAQVGVGESVTLKVKLKGNGVLEGTEGPKLPALSGVKVYPDKPSIEQDIDVKDGLISEATYSYALVPSKVGSLNFESPSLWIFVPRLGSYVELKADLPTLNVIGGADVAADGGKNDQIPGLAKKNIVRQLRSDLLGIHTGKSLLKNQSLNRRDLWVLIFWNLILFLSFLVVVFLHKFQKEAPRLRNSIKKQFATKNLEKQLNFIQPTQEDFEARVLHAFYDFVESIFNMRTQAFTVSELQKIIADRCKLSSESLNQTEAVLSRLENSRYGAEKIDSDEWPAFKASLLRIAEDLFAKRLRTK